MKKIFLKIFFLLFFVAIAFFGFILIKKGQLLYEKFGELKNLDNQISRLQKENDLLHSEIKFFNNPSNLEKEARSVLNYKKPGEKLAIIIDEAAGSVNNVSSTMETNNSFLEKFKNFFGF